MHHAISVFLILMLAGAKNPGEPDRVKTANGVIQGTGRQASGVRMFKGIPFAAPPTGDLRWRPPQPVKNWDGVREADTIRPALHAAPHLRRHEFPVQRNERGLPLPQRLDAGEVGERSFARACVLLRRRLRRRRRIGASLRRREHGHARESSR